MNMLRAYNNSRSNYEYVLYGLMTPRSFAVQTDAKLYGSMAPRSFAVQTDVILEKVVFATPALPC